MMSESEKWLLNELTETAKRMSNAGKEILILKGNAIADYEDFLRSEKEEPCTAEDLAKC